MSIVFSAKLDSVPANNIHSAGNYYAGYALFWSGITVGMCNLICGVSVGINIIALENEPGKSEKTMIEDFSSIPLEELQDTFGIYKDTLPT